MKKIIFFTATFLALGFANQYNIYDVNGRNCGSYNGVLDKNDLARIAKKYHGSILVKKVTQLDEGFHKYINRNQQFSALINQVEKKITLSQDSLDKNSWLEVEKNEIVKICLDNQVIAWETSLNAVTISDSCIVFRSPTLAGSETIKTYLSEEGHFHTLNLAVGMKYLDFQNKEVLVGYGTNTYNNTTTSTDKGIFILEEEDPQRLMTITATYLVDKYPITNCEIVQQMWESIPESSSIQDQTTNEYTKEWIIRKAKSIHSGFCPVQDSATSTISLYQAMNYANTRSKKEGLKPYYTFSKAQTNHAQILSKGQYIISYFDYVNHEESFIQVSIDYSSNGYRLPFYDEWMFLARGGDTKNNAPWGDSATAEAATKYAKFYNKNDYYNDHDETGLVGLLTPNGYGLYDIFGLVEEHVLFEQNNPFELLKNNYSKKSPSCFKGGSNHNSWEYVNYGYKSANYYSANVGGFRLIRKLK